MGYLPPYQQPPAIVRQAEQAQKQYKDVQKAEAKRRNEERKRQLAAEMRRRSEQTKQKR